eukprot:m.262861 g.262861  ORF g.262861 m.262861 type:complete len:101 (-) comp15597_c0_seq2:2182-2484(-)
MQYLTSTMCSIARATIARIIAHTITAHHTLQQINTDQKGKVKQHVYKTPDKGGNNEGRGCPHACFQEDLCLQAVSVKIYLPPGEGWKHTTAQFECNANHR